MEKREQYEISKRFEASLTQKKRNLQTQKTKIVIRAGDQRLTLAPIGLEAADIGRHCRGWRSYTRAEVLESYGKEGLVSIRVNYDNVSVVYHYSD